MLIYDISTFRYSGDGFRYVSVGIFLRSFYVISRSNVQNSMTFIFYRQYGTICKVFSLDILKPNHNVKYRYKYNVYNLFIRILSLPQS